LLKIRDRLRSIGKRFELSSRPAVRLDRVGELAVCRSSSCRGSSGVPDYSPGTKLPWSTPTIAEMSPDDAYEVIRARWRVSEDPEEKEALWEWLAKAKRRRRAAGSEPAGCRQGT
jgi:hypothetical protein